MRTVAPAEPRPLRAPARAAALAALALLPMACGRGSPAPPAPEPVRYAADGRPEGAVGTLARWNVLWVCLDTVRADALLPWATGAPKMPLTSELLGRETVAFADASSPAPWTGPAVASMLTGLLPSEHGGRELSDAFRVVPAVPTAFEVLGAQGWRTGAFTGGGWVSTENGVLQGVDRDEAHAPFSFAGAGTMLLRAQRLTRTVRPRLLFLHTFEAHDPYLGPPASPGDPPPTPPAVDLAAVDREAEQDGGRALVRRFLLDAGSRAVVFGGVHGRRRLGTVTRWFERGVRSDPAAPALVAEAKAAYEAGLARLDRALAAWLSTCLTEGLLDDAVLVVTADHGEGFGEHGTMHHGRRLYDELLRVPLFVRAPGWPRGKVVRGSCSVLDVLPTLLDLVGLPPMADVAGRSLAPLVRGGPGRPVVAEERRTEAETGLPRDETLVSVRDERRKWIRTVDHRSGAATEEAYDLEADPGEERPLSASTVDGWPAAFRDAVRDARARGR